MKFNSKIIYYWIIIGIGLITGLLTLNIIRSRNKYPSTYSIKNILTLYINKLYSMYNPHKDIDRVKYVKDLTSSNTKLSLKDNITMYTYPFQIEFIESNSQKFGLQFHKKENILVIENINQLSEKDFNDSFFKFFLSKFALNINNTLEANEILYDIKENLPIYRSVNIYVWIPDNLMEFTRRYNGYIDKIIREGKILLKIGPIVVKLLIYNSENGVRNNPDLYKDIKALNPKRLFDELNDDDLFNIHLINENNENDKINTYYNDDLNSFIFGLNFDTSINSNLFIYITKYLQFFNLFTKKQNILLSSYIDNRMINELIKLFNHPDNMRHLKFLAMLNNMEKISRIFPLYESILTVDKVKEKVGKIMDVLKNSVKDNFNAESLKNLDEIYVDSLYLMNSNELVIFEHFFSNEFKIGQFLPVTAPILYVLHRAIKALTY